MRLGRDEVMRLLPHRPPLLLVDTVDEYRDKPFPTLLASFAVTSDNPVFAGHFPGRPIWPGAYLVEGLAQCCHLLAIITGFRAAANAAPQNELVKMHQPALLASVDMKFLQPVAPSNVVEYEVVWAGRQPSETLILFDAEARVARAPVARGRLIVAGPPRF